VVRPGLQSGETKRPYDVFPVQGVVFFGANGQPPGLPKGRLPNLFRSQWSVEPNGAHHANGIGRTMSPGEDVLGLGLPPTFQNWSSCCSTGFSLGVKQVRPQGDPTTGRPLTWETTEADRRTNRNFPVRAGYTSPNGKRPASCNLTWDRTVPAGTDWSRESATDTAADRSPRDELFTGRTAPTPILPWNPTKHGGSMSFLNRRTHCGQTTASSRCPGAANTPVHFTVHLGPRAGLAVVRQTAGREKRARATRNRPVARVHRHMAVAVIGGDWNRRAHHHRHGDHPPGLAPARTKLAGQAPMDNANRPQAHMAEKRVPADPTAPAAGLRVTRGPRPEHHHKTGRPMAGRRSHGRDWSNFLPAKFGRTAILNAVSQSRPQGTGVSLSFWPRGSHHQAQ